MEGVSILPNDHAWERKYVCYLVTSYLYIKIPCFKIFFTYKYNTLCYFIIIKYNFLYFFVKKYELQIVFRCFFQL